MSNAIFPLVMHIDRDSSLPMMHGQWRHVGRAGKGGKYDLEATYRTPGELALCEFIAGIRTPEVIEAAMTA